MDAITYPSEKWYSKSTSIWSKFDQIDVDLMSFDVSFLTGIYFSLP